jgi:hypothetical protein
MATEKKPKSDSAEERMKKYARDRQGLKDWTEYTIKAHAAAIAMTMEFEEGSDEPILPTDKKLLAELDQAAVRFERTPAAMWRVLRKYYRESDVALDAWADQFVSDHIEDLQEANRRRQIGDDIDDDEPVTEAEADPKLSFAARAKEAAAEAADEFKRKKEEVQKAIQRAISRAGLSIRPSA